MTALHDLAREIASRPPPRLVGIGGAVAVGKTKIADELALEIEAVGRSVRVISTDAFLLPNAVLAERNILMRKGFPESYDIPTLTSALQSAKERSTTTIPVYSHRVYDIVPDETEEIGPVDVVVLEGVIALQEPVVSLLDLAIYVDAPEDVVRGWFVQRFSRLTHEARGDESSFYSRFSQLDVDGVRSIAEGTWDGINGVNLRDHIEPSMSGAHIVISKGGGHEILDVRRVR